MFNIDYSIITSNLEKVNSITVDDIHYDFLLGNVCIYNGGKKIQMDWEWIPLLDFFLLVLNIVDRFQKIESSEERFEFTESADYIDFSYKNGNIRIAPSFSKVQLDVDLDIFYDTLKRKLEEIHNIISKEGENKLSMYLKMFLNSLV